MKKLISNIASALDFYYNENNIEEVKHQNYTLLSKYKESTLTQYIENNMNIYLDAYLQFAKDDIRDDIEVAYSLINNNSIEEGKRKKYISALEERIPYISKVENEIFYNQLLEENKLIPDTENILQYFEYCENRWTEDLIEFVNSNKDIIEFNYPADSTEYDEDFKLLFFKLTAKENSLCKFQV